jgi:hypothetical protein
MGEAGWGMIFFSFFSSSRDDATPIITNFLTVRPFFLLVATMQQQQKQECMSDTC